MTPANPTILVIGATGAMGRSVVQNLVDEQSHPWQIKALTRNVNSDRSQALQALSDRIELVQGDVNDQESLKKAIQGVHGVFCNTDYWSAGSKAAEISQSKMMIEICKSEKVSHFIYSSLENCLKISDGKVPVPYFDSKAAVEEYIDEQRQQGDEWFLKNTTVLVTAPYLENFEGYFLPKNRIEPDGSTTLVFSVPMDDKPLTMVALDDIGWFAAYIFANPQKTLGKTLKIASDSLTMQEFVKIFTKITGLTAEYEPITLQQFREASRQGVQDIANSPDGDFVGNMFQFCQEYGIHRDFQELRHIHPHLLSFETWLKKTGWHGEKQEVQKYLQDYSQTQASK
ncbi:MAG: NmrA/HSCARG family protein [Aphanothece sp. CMT-3BRIN-NPC111]|jgi:uncharacterized protein YbjT (DUF2867 family)|nr:NmrA/HSCARG family protein [Aphanothece sp. CMT-3BRIN-NPC111]